MRGFKHISAEFAAAFRSGESVKIGTFGYYRSMEGPRADPYEGSVVCTPGPILGDFDPNDPDHSAKKRALSSLGIVATGPLKDIGIIGVKGFWRLPEEYLFCCSKEPDLSLLEKGQLIFEIADLREFAREIAKVKPAFLGAPQADLVSYKDRTADTLISDAPQQGPFFKSRRFAFEKEIRIVWALPHAKRGTALEPFLLLKCPAVARLITPIRT